MEKNEKEVNYWSDSDESDETDEESQRKYVQNDERRCKYCVKLFRNKSNVEKHEKTCKIGAKNTASLVTAKNGDLRFLCGVCYRTFKFLTGLTKHKLRHEPPGGYECKFCNNTRFCTDVDLQKHKETMHMVYKCKICKEKLDSRDKYVEHVLHVHDGREMIYAICEDCGQQFRTSSVLSYHKQSMCGTIKPFTCDQCGSKFQNQWSLKNHLQIHKGEKKFCCSYCGNSFMNKGQLVVHERKHTKEKPYVCNICSKAFSYRESLVTHSSVHTGIKPYLCEACGACFSCFSNLQKHRHKRPNTCGQPQYNKNAKIAPRPSFKSGKLIREIKVGKGKLVLDDIKKLTKKESNNGSKMVKCKSKKSAKTDNALQKIDENHDNENNQSPAENNIKNENIPTKNVKKEDKFNAAGAKIQLNVNSEMNIDDDSKKQKISKLENPVNDAVVETANSKDNGFHIFELKISELSDNDEHEYEHDYEIQIYNESSNNSNDDDRNTENLLNHIEIINNSSSYLNENLKKENNEKLLNFKEQNEDDDNALCTKNVRKEKSVKQIKNLEVKFEEIDIDNTCDNDDDNHDNDDDRDDEDNDNDDDDDIPLSRIKDKISLEKQLQSSKNSTNDDQKIIKENQIIEITAKTDNDNEIPSTHPSTSSKSNNLNSKRSENLKKSNFIIKDANQSFECDKCPKFYNQRKSYVKHLVTDHDMNLIEVEKSLDEIEMIRCRYCAKIYKKNVFLKRHEKLHGPNGKLIHKCPCCLKYFETIEEVKRHTEAKHADKLTCTVCQKVYYDLKALMAHRKRLHSTKVAATTETVTFSDNCGDGNGGGDNNSTEDNIEKFINERMKRMQHVCQKCGRKFSSKTILNNHERSDCGQNPLYKCDICDKRFHSSGTLKTHINIHTKETLWKCTYCQKPFSTSGQLRVHEKKHTGIKPFKCDKCDKAFTHRESLFTHMSVHTGVKRFTCYGCGTRFSCISNLKNHRSTHFNTCGLLPLNTKPISFMGYERGVLYMGKKPFE